MSRKWAKDGGFSVGDGAVTSRYRKRWSHTTGESYVVGEGPGRTWSALADFPHPMIIRDLQEPVFSPADGRTYTSRKHWRDHLKAHDMVELGNEMPTGPKPAPAITEADVAAAYEQFDQQGPAPETKDRPPAGWEGDPAAMAVEDTS